MLIGSIVEVGFHGALEDAHDRAIRGGRAELAEAQGVELPLANPELARRVAQLSAIAGGAIVDHRRHVEGGGGRIRERCARQLGAAGERAAHVVDGDANVLIGGSYLEGGTGVRRGKSGVGHGRTRGEVDAAEAGPHRRVVAEPSTANEEMTEPSAQALEAAELAGAARERTGEVHAAILR